MYQTICRSNKEPRGWSRPPKIRDAEPHSVPVIGAEYVTFRLAFSLRPYFPVSTGCQCPCMADQPGGECVICVTVPSSVHLRARSSAHSMAPGMPRGGPKGNGHSCAVHGIYCSEPMLQLSVAPAVLRRCHVSSELGINPPKTNHHMIRETPMASHSSSSWCLLFTATAPLLTRRFGALGLSAWLLISIATGNLGAQEPPDTNYDEAAVGSYELPDPLTSFDGRRIQNAGMWCDVRRPEILEAFRREVYGRVPAFATALRCNVTKVDPVALGGLAIRKEIRIDLFEAADAPHIDLLLYIPAKGTGPFPRIGRPMALRQASAERGGS